MRVQDQITPELRKLAELINNIPVAMLTSYDQDRQLLSRPMAPLEMDYQGAVWFFTHRTFDHTANLRQMNLAFTDLDKGTYVSISGTGELIDNPTRIRALWTTAAKPWFPDGPDSPDLALLKFTPQSAEYWDTPNSKMVRLLSMAVSVMAGKPVGLGTHNTLHHLQPDQNAASKSAATLN